MRRTRARAGRRARLLARPRRGLSAMPAHTGARAAFGSPTAGLLAAAALLGDARDIVAQRVVCARPPPWLAADESVLGWLDGLSTADVLACERLGLCTFLQTTPRTPPPRLARLASSVAAVRAHFPPAPPPPPPGARPARRVSPRKHAQIGAVAAAVERSLQQRAARRVVDVGGGHGHLSSLLASVLADAAVPTEVVCLDRDAALLATGRALHAARGAPGRLSFVLADAVAGDGRGRAGADDLVVALHACGALGDCVVEDAAKAGGAGSLVLVSCCLQKLQEGVAVRRPLSAAAAAGDVARALTLDRRLLGLTNRVRGYVSESDMTARVTRVALRRLLAGRGIAAAGGDGRRLVDGLSRHAIRRGLGAVAAEALARHGDARAAGRGEISRCEGDARAEYERMRVLTLPRAMVGEVLEMAVVLDRAALLEESGRFGRVRTCRLFGDDVSMRNLCIEAA